MTFEQVLEQFYQQKPPLSVDLEIEEQTLVLYCAQDIPWRARMQYKISRVAPLLLLLLFLAAIIRPLVSGIPINFTIDAFVPIFILLGIGVYTWRTLFRPIQQAYNQDLIVGQELILHQQGGEVYQYNTKQEARLYLTFEWQNIKSILLYEESIAGFEEPAYIIQLKLFEQAKQVHVVDWVGKNEAINYFVNVMRALHHFHQEGQLPANWNKPFQEQTILTVEDYNHLITEE